VWNLPPLAADERNVAALKDPDFYISTLWCNSLGRTGAGKLCTERIMDADYV
jgi:hypothetical protein